MRKTLSTLTLAAAAALTLAGCSSADDGPGLEIHDAWVRTADDGMTAAFGVIDNTTNHDITITAGSSPSAGMIELHEVSEVAGEMSMHPIDGGFVVPAGESISLEPGGWHIMFMNIPAPIEAGDEVSVTLDLDSGDTFAFIATAKDFTGAEEGYDDSEDMADMDMGDE